MSAQEVKPIPFTRDNATRIATALYHRSVSESLGEAAGHFFRIIAGDPTVGAQEALQLVEGAWQLAKHLDAGLAQALRIIEHNSSDPGGHRSDAKLILEGLRQAIIRGEPTSPDVSSPTPGVPLGDKPMRVKTGYGVTPNDRVVLNRALDHDKPLSPESQDKVDAAMMSVTGVLKPRKFNDEGHKLMIDRYDKDGKLIASNDPNHLDADGNVKPIVRPKALDRIHVDEDEIASQMAENTAKDIDAEAVEKLVEDFNRHTNTSGAPSPAPPPFIASSDVIIIDGPEPKPDAHGDTIDPEAKRKAIEEWRESHIDRHQTRIRVIWAKETIPGASFTTEHRATTQLRIARNLMLADIGEERVVDDYIVCAKDGTKLNLAATLHELLPHITAGPLTLIKVER